MHSERRPRKLRKAPRPGLIPAYFDHPENLRSESIEEIAKEQQNSTLDVQRYNGDGAQNGQLLTQRDREVLLVIDRTVERGMRQLGDLVTQHGAVSVKINERKDGVNVKIERLCFACNEYIGTAIHFGRHSSTATKTQAYSPS